MVEEEGLEQQRSVGQQNSVREKRIDRHAHTVHLRDGREQTLGFPSDRGEIEARRRRNERMTIEEQHASVSSQDVGRDVHAPDSHPHRAR